MSASVMGLRSVMLQQQADAAGGMSSLGPCRDAACFSMCVFYKLLLIGARQPQIHAAFQAGSCRQAGKTEEGQRQRCAWGRQTVPHR